MSKYGGFSGPYFPIFGLNTEIYVFSPNLVKYGPEKTPYLDTFHTVVKQFYNLHNARQAIKITMTGKKEKFGNISGERFIFINRQRKDRRSFKIIYY